LKRICALLVTISGAMMVGCGGGGGGLKGSPATDYVVTVNWSAAGGSAARPKVATTANSVKIELFGSSVTPVTSRVVNAPSIGTTSTVSITGIPVGTYTVITTAYAYLNGTGTALARGAAVVNVQAPAITNSTFALSGHPAAVAEASSVPSLVVGGVSQLAAIARDAAGQNILLPPTDLAWTSDTGGVTVDGQGVATAHAPGTAHITVVEGETGRSATGTLSVSLPSGHPYALVDLGTILYSGTAASGINASNVVCGTAFDVAVTPANNSQSIQYSGGTLKTVLPTHSAAYGINGAGQIVGGFVSLSQNDHNLYTYPYLLSNGVVTQLGDGQQGVALGINSTGAVTGYAGPAKTPDGTPKFTHAFLFSSGVMTDLGSLSTAANDATTGAGINDAGQVTGWGTVGAGTHAFLYSGGKMKDLGVPATYSSSRGTAINNSGQIAATAASSSVTRAFRYSGGTFTDLGVLKGASSSEALAVNDNGIVVGESGGKACLFTGGTVTDLNTLIAPTTDFVMQTATGINAAGVICGQGMANGSSQPHAYILIPTSTATSNRQ
jgi:probable HAF family extracellular repeat protein